MVVHGCKPKHLNYVNYIEDNQQLLYLIVYYAKLYMTKLEKLATKYLKKIGEYSINVIEKSVYYK